MGLHAASAGKCIPALQTNTKQGLQSCLTALTCGGAQVKNVKGDDVICTALNDAHMDGLLTVIHSEKEGDGMSSSQTDLPLLTDYDEKAIKAFVKEFEVSAITASASSPSDQSQQHRLHLFTDWDEPYRRSAERLLCTPCFARRSIRSISSQCVWDTFGLVNCSLCIFTCVS